MSVGGARMTTRNNYIGFRVAQHVLVPEPLRSTIGRDRLAWERPDPMGAARSRLRDAIVNSRH